IVDLFWLIFRSLYSSLNLSRPFLILSFIRDPKSFILVTFQSNSSGHFPYQRICEGFNLLSASRHPNSKASAACLLFCVPTLDMLTMLFFGSPSKHHAKLSASLQQIVGITCIPCICQYAPIQCLR